MSKDKLSIQPYKGTRDFFPEEMAKLNYISAIWQEVVESFGYEQYQGPILESFDVYAAKSGEELVNEQLYSFTDRGDRKVAIRPEMTPTVSRMIAARASQMPKPIRWYSIANFMRYEKPQRGRAREFYQLNADIFGVDSMRADAEIIDMAVSIMRAFGANESMFQIRVNNRKWINYWTTEVLGYSGEVAALTRVIDRMGKQSVDKTQEQLKEVGLSDEQVQLVVELPALTIEDMKKYADKADGAREIVELFELLVMQELQSYVVFDSSIMRGLDYYTGTIFEQFDLNSENNRSMFGGGRYDGLVDMFGGEPIAAVGFAPGDIPMMLFLESWNLLPDFITAPEVLVTVFDEGLVKASWDVAATLRETGISTELYINVGDGIGNQLSYANRKNIRFAIIVGDAELDSGNVVLKDLESGEQEIIPVQSAIERITRYE